MAASDLSINRSSHQNGSQQSTNAKLLAVLNFPLSNRCQEICYMIEEGSMKDLQTIFPPLIDSIFGLNFEIDWGLKSLSRGLHTRDFEMLRQFLAPDGPVLRLVYRLMSDSNIRYDFPVACLPVPTRRALEEGVIPMMYVNKFQMSIPGRIPTVISLNAFEYYMFHFAYYLVNPYNLKVISNWTVPGEAIYPTVVDDYLQYFLPTEGTVVTPLTTSPISPASPAVINRLCSSISSYTMKHHTPLAQPFRLLKNNNFAKTNITSPLQLTEQSQMETWLSETIAQIFAEMWLVQNSVENCGTNLLIPSQTHPLAGFGIALPCGSVREPYWVTEPSSAPFHPLFCFETFTVNYDHMRTVRMLAKHFHYFTNSYTVGSVNPIEELKRTVVPHLFQKKFYSFLQYSIANWPLDASFRLVLETWLSYIQPWRYLSLQSTRSFYSERNEEKERAVDFSWQKFIVENLAFYTIIFQRILPRFFRMDLSTPKNAYMLYRITKVFSQPNLSFMIANAESNLMDPMSPVSCISDNRGSSVNKHTSTRSSILSPGLVTVARQQLLELERPGFQYVPLFGTELQLQIYQLLTLVNQAQRTAQESQPVLENKPGFFGQCKRTLVSLFDSNAYDTNSEDYTPQDSRKVDVHLGTAVEQLCTIFKLQQLSRSSNYTSSGENLNISQPSLSETVLSDTSLLTSQFQRRKVTFQGNPDIQPIRSFELGFLVRLLYQLSLYFNEKYRTQLRHLYHRTDFVGQFCKQFLAGPVIYYQYDKRSVPPSRLQKVLPPRVNLRPLAHKQTIGYILAIIFLAWIWGFHPCVTALLIVGIVLFISTIRAGIAALNQLRGCVQLRTERLQAS